MATGMHMDKRNVDCLVLGHHDQDRKVSATHFLSGYRELLLNCIFHAEKAQFLQEMRSTTKKYQNRGIMNWLISLTISHSSINVQTYIL